MPDLPTKTTEKVEFIKRGVVGPGKNIKIIVGGVTILDKDVPAGKKLRGTIKVEGRLENA